MAAVSKVKSKREFDEKGQVLQKPNSDLLELIQNLYQQNLIPQRLWQFEGMHFSSSL